MTQRLLATAIGAVLLSATIQSAEAASSGVYFRLGDGSTVSQDSSTGPISTSEGRVYDFGSSFQYGAASFQQQTTRARTSLEQHGNEPPGSWITADTEADYSKDIVVPTGQFGPPGTLISMPLTLRFDGSSLASGGFFSAGRSLSSIDTSFSFQVLDLDEQICGEGCRPAEIASFGFRGYVSFDSGFGAAGRESVAHYYWVAEENNGVVASDDYNYYKNESGVLGSGETRYSVDTGTLNLNLNTRTGHTLLLQSSLDVFAQSMSINGWSNVVGDFSRTFDADLFLPVPGVALEGEVLGVYSPEPVPLPGAVWGMGAGLAMLVGWRRRARS